MADYKGDTNKLVESDYLYKQFKNFDIRRAKKLEDALYNPEIPEHYELDNVAGTLTIVDDGTLSDPLTEVELSTVTSKILDADDHVYILGDKVNLISLKPKEEIYLKSSTLLKETENLDFSTF